MGKYKKMFEKAEHKYLKNVYLGKEKVILVKKKGLRKDSPKRNALEQLLNYAYLKNYGKMKQNIIVGFLYGEETK
jgi:hypothetical protein